MPKIRIKQVDAFTTVPQTGNPAGVVLAADQLSASQMQLIAREMSLPETAFVLPPLKHEADVKIRWFTPSIEVPLCGHATIASFHALSEEKQLGMSGNGEFRFQMESASGILPIQVIKDNGSSTVKMGIRIPAFERMSQYKADLVRVLDIPKSEFDASIPIFRHDYLYAPVKRLHTLFTLRPNFLAITQFLDARSLRGLCLFTLETIDRESFVHVRFFAPNLGINEDPVTGSAQGPLAAILYEHGGLQKQNGRILYQGEQGDAMGRRGRVQVELLLEDERPQMAMIGGQAVTVLEGEMLFQE